MVDTIDTKGKFVGAAWVIVYLLFLVMVNCFVLRPPDWRDYAWFGGAVGR